MFSVNTPLYPNELPRRVPNEGVPVREDVLFTNHKGEQDSGIRRRNEKALRVLAPALQKILQRDEAVFYMARAQSPVSVWEQLTWGAVLQSVTAALLVFTNRRLLHIHVTRTGAWRRSTRSLHWGDLADSKVKGWLLPRTLTLRYRDGKKEMFWGIRAADAKKMKSLLPALADPAVAEMSPQSTMVSICPECLAALTPQVYRCAQCGLGFKDEKTMMQRSLLIPGGAFFYTEHPMLGLWFGLVESLFTVGLVVNLMVANWAEAVAGAMIVGLAKAMSIYHARRFVREFLPLREELAREGASAAAMGAGQS